MAEPIRIRYTFTHAADTETYEVVLDGQTMEQIFDAPNPPPDWTALEFEKCKGCPLSEGESPQCPLALSLDRLVRVSGRLLSFEAMDARVDTPDKTVIKKTTAQRAISSLLGLHMATSACPNMKLLRPMARFHSPFASREETLFRAASTYLLGQYFLLHRGKHADMDLDGLQKAYSKIHAVNVGIARRLRHVSQGDANLNALVLLDLFAQQVPSAISERMNEIEYVFAPYFDE